MPMTHSRREEGMYGDIMLFSGTGCPELSGKIASYLGVPLAGRDIVMFPNENILVKLHTSVRGKDVYVIQTTSRPVHYNLMELLIMLQTLRLDSAARITAVIPYMCYARSDKKDQPRVPITARLVADMIEVAGADRYMTLDLHAGQIQGFFSIPGDVLTAFHILVAHVKEMQPTLKDPVVVAADLGFAKKGRNFAARINTPIAFVEKRRIGNRDSAEALSLIGDVFDRDVIIVDDEVDTGGSVVQAVQLVKEQGARDVYLVFVHPVFSNDAAKRLAGLPLTKIVTTDTIPISDEKEYLLADRLEVLSVSPLLGGGDQTGPRRTQRRRDVQRVALRSLQMPELPEVETIARALRDGTQVSPEGESGFPLPGREILGAHLLWERTLAEPSPRKFCRQIVGQSFQDVSRRGKFLIFELSSDVMLVHLRMTGDLYIESGDKPYATHHRLVLDLDGNRRLAFNDTRKFGRVWLINDPAHVLGELGPEPLDANFGSTEFFRRLHTRRRQIKPLLLDQKFLAGVGNIYADEALFRARIHPQTLADQLTLAQAERLLAAIRRVLEEGILRNGASIDWAYRGGEFQNHFQVYGRSEEECFRCGGPISRITVGQRSTHFCPHCQSAPV